MSNKIIAVAKSAAYTDDMTTPTKSAGATLALWRASQEPVLTQTDLAKLLGVASSFISLLERGHKLPGLALATLIERVTGNGNGPCVMAGSWHVKPAKAKKRRVA